MLKAGNYTIDDKALALSLARLGGTAREVLVLELGGGIPDEDLRNVFKRFYRVDKARSRAAGGTGLGLSIVSDTVSRRGGAIRAESIPAGGTRFLVTMPCRLLEEDV